MDLSARLRTTAFARPHLLVVAAPAAVETRLAVEHYAQEHGWPSADSPADADVLVVAGGLTPDLAAVVGILETQIPAPWTRVELDHPDEVQAELDSVPTRLASWPAEHPAAADHRRTAETRQDHDGHNSSHGQQQHEDESRDDDGLPDLAHPGAHQDDERGPQPEDDTSATKSSDESHAHHSRGGHEMGGVEMGGVEMGGVEMGGVEMGGVEMGGVEMGGHEHHMGAVGGLPMAGRAPDRDGLKLDALHVPLGPVLPFWPSGLRLLLTVQGDVVQEVAVETLGSVQGAGPPFWNEPMLRALAGERVPVGAVARRRAASQLDSLMRLLAVAGWDAPALRCAVLRDRVLSGEPAARLSAAYRPFGRRVVRSRLLRRMVGGLGDLDAAASDRLGVSGPAAIGGDVWARLCRWVQAIQDDLASVDDPSPAADVEGPRGRLDRDRPPSAVLLDALPPLLVGAELAAVRLVVASFDPDLAELSLLSAVTVRG